MTRKTSFNNIQASFSSWFFGNNLRVWGRGGRRGCDGYGRHDSQDRGKKGNNTTSDYKNVTCHLCQKKEYIANYYTEPAQVPNDNNISGMTLRVFLLRAVLFFLIGHLKNLDLLDSEATDHVHNSQNAFIHFYPIKKIACTATEEQIISYSWEDNIKKFTCSNVMFTNVFYIFTLINNIYSVSCLYHWK